MLNRIKVYIEGDFFPYFATYRDTNRDTAMDQIPSLNCLGQNA